MNLLSIENLSKSYTEKVLFSNISFGLEKGQKVAFVAKNGTGKSTLLRIIAGKETADSGNCILRKDTKVGFLDQQPVFDPNKTVIEAVLDSSGEVMNAVKEYEIALNHPEREKELQAAFDKMDSLQAWDYEQRVHQILSVFKITNLEQKVEQLSGGQKKRIALVKLLVEEPDLLIMDEPTNHLDIEMIEWLEDYLSKENITLFMVTHDRWFLEVVCNEIMELDGGTVYRYKGNYSYFLEKKEAREENDSTNKDRARQFLKKELEWIRKQPRARGTKSKSRVDAFHDLSEATGKKKKEEKLELEIKLERLGGKILELYHINKAYGDKTVLKDFSYKFRQGEKLSIIGKNGVGKSTFLNIITGKEQPDTGKVIVGETVSFGYYTQDGMKLKEDLRMIEVIKEIGDHIPLAKGKTMSASQLLEKFLFPSSSHFTPVSKLSGGEKRRLYLLTILIKNPNFLILDEPTNDLDIMTLQVLEDFLEQFMGCLIVVSHDRYFMDKLTHHTFVFEGDGIVRDFNGNYSQYREEVEEKKLAPQKALIKPPQVILKEEKAAEKAAEKPVEKAKPKEKQRMGFNEKWEFSLLEKELPELEKKKEELVEKLNSGITDNDELMKISAELTETIEAIDNKTNRWLELSEMTS
ncbi:MAG: ABC-F family ATP-binding cassette domain-containing protein [Bacteroidia bacterium]